MPILRMAFSRDRREDSLLLLAEHLKLLFRGRRVRFFDVLRETRSCLAWRPRRSADFQICCIAGFQLFPTRRRFAASKTAALATALPIGNRRYSRLETSCVRHGG